MDAPERRPIGAAYGLVVLTGSCRLAVLIVGVLLVIKDRIQRLQVSGLRIEPGVDVLLTDIDDGPVVSGRSDLAGVDWHTSPWTAIAGAANIDYLNQPPVTSRPTLIGGT